MSGFSAVLRLFMENSAILVIFLPSLFDSAYTVIFRCDEVPLKKGPSARYTFSVALLKWLLCAALYPAFPFQFSTS